MIYKLNKELNTFWLLILSFFIGSYTLVGQDAKRSVSELKKKYPSVNELILESKAHYFFTLEKGAVKVFLETYEESMILSGYGIGRNEDYLYESELHPLIDYEAYSVSPDNKKQKAEKIKDVRDKRHVFHDDYQEYKLIYSGLEMGSKKVKKSRHEIKDFHLVSPFLFINGDFSEKLELTIEADKDIEIGHKIFNDSQDIAYTSVSKKGKTIHQWTRSDAKPPIMETGSPGLKYHAPHLCFYVASIDISGNKKQVLGSPDLLFDYYKNFTNKLNQNKDETLSAIAKSITDTLVREEDKVKNILYWVKDHIKYIAYEDGYGGFIPREASLVNERKFGDCKDMASIITALASHAKVDSVFLAWIGTRELPYTYKELPTPITDNHMIAVYIHDGKVLPLDATDTYTPFGLPSPFIQGKECMIRLSNDSFMIYKIPIISPQINRRVNHVSMQVVESKLIGKGKMAVHGLYKTEYLATLSNTNQEERFRNLKGLISFGNNKFKAGSIQELGADRRDEPLIIEYDFELDSYISVLGNEIYFNPFFDFYKFFEIFNESRKGPYGFKISTSDQNVLEINIPEGYTPVLPEIKSIQNDFFDFESAFEFKGRTIYNTQSLKVKKLIINKADFESWNKEVSKLKMLLKSNIILKK